MDYNIILAQLLHACKLAQDLERNIHDTNALISNPERLLGACEEVAGAFREPINHLRSAAVLINPDLILSDDQPMDLYDHQLGGGGSGSHDHHGHNIPFFGLMQQAMAQPLLGQQTLQLALDTTGGGGVEVQSGAGDGSSSGGRPEQRSSRKRKGAVTKLVPAPRTGNPDLLPDDGYTWRKYGQKDILNSRFPRSYFRCTHKNYGCKAKKYVQRREDDPFTFEITYRVDHTCQTSLTPLLIPRLAPNSSININGDGTGDGTDDPRGISTSYSNYLGFLPAETTQSLEVLLSTSIQLNNSWTRPELLMTSHPMQTLIMASSRSTEEGTSRQAEEEQGGRDHVVDHFPVADLADVMFNSGSSGINMDGIFSSKRDYKD